MKPHGPEYEHKAVHSGLEATCVRFNLSGSLLGTGGADSVVKIWDMMQGGLGECTDSVKLFGTKPVSCIAFSSTGDLLMACSVDRQLKFYSLKFHRVMNQVTGAHSDMINACSFCYA